MKKSLLIITFLSLLFSIKVNAQIIINEYSCSNIKQFKYDTVSYIWDDSLYYEFDTLWDDWEDWGNWGDDTWVEKIIDSTYPFYTDNFGKTEDWFELYNAGSTSVNLFGYSLSDSKKKLQKFVITQNISIAPHDFLIVWASGRDTIINDTIHTSFKLSQSGKSDNIVISNLQGIIVDSVKIQSTHANQSRGRTIDGGENWSIFTNPSPDSSNNQRIPFSGYAPEPIFSVDAGFYNSSISVEITNTGNTYDIYFTIDGTAPDTSSTLYSGTIIISKTTVLKARAYSHNADTLPGYIHFATYFINESHTLPVISVSGTMLDSLANGEKELRPWGSIEYFDENKNLIATSYGEFNSHGQDSWVNDHRSIDFVAKDQLGYSKELKVKLFNTSKRDAFQRIILRAAGDDNFPAATDGVHNESNLGSAHMRDAYFQNLCKTGGLKLDVRTASKCIVYLNGEYWGVYDIREIPDDHDYTKYYYDQDENDIQYILTWGSTWSQYGKDKALEDWAELKYFILTNNMKIQQNFDYVDSKLNIKSLSDYVISHSLSVSSDWLNYNTGWWRGLNPDGDHKKWGYILWDNDASFAFYINYTGIADTSATAALCNVDNLTDEWSDPEQHITILNKLRTNPEFNNYYIMRYNDLMNTTFSCENMLRQFDSTYALIQPEMQRQIDRWPGGTYEEWENNVKRLRYFIERRCGVTTNSKLDSCYNLTGPFNVEFDVSPEKGGTINVNSLKIDSFPWNAKYFGGIKMEVKGKPNDTIPYYFKNWNSTKSIFSLNKSIADNSVKIISTDKITAFFTKELILGLDEGLKDNNIYIYPSVVKDKTTVVVELSETSEALKIELISMNGTSNILFQSQATNIHDGIYSLEIEPANFSYTTGTYIVQVTIDDSVYSEKFIYVP